MLVVFIIGIRSKLTRLWVALGHFLAAEGSYSLVIRIKLTNQITEISQENISTSVSQPTVRVNIKVIVSEII